MEGAKGLHTDVSTLRDINWIRPRLIYIQFAKLCNLATNNRPFNHEGSGTSLSVPRVHLGCTYGQTPEGCPQDFLTAIPIFFCVNGLLQVIDKELPLKVVGEEDNTERLDQQGMEEGDVALPEDVEQGTVSALILFV